LHIITFFKANENIVTSIFLEYENEEVPSIAYKKTDIDGALHLLVKNIMIKSDSDEIIQIKDTAQNLISSCIESDKVPKILECGLRLLIPYISEEPIRDFDIQQSILLHAQSLWNHVLKYDDLVRNYATFVLDLCEKLCDFDKFRIPIFELANESTNAMRRLFGKNDEKSIRIEYFKAVGILQMGDFKMCRHMLFPLFQLSTTHLGSNHKV